MIQQTNLTPSGFQYWNKHTLGVSRNRFAFCSTLSVYIYDLHTKQVEKILANHDATITTFTWNPKDQNFFATTSVNGSMDVWDIDGEKSKIKIQLQSYKPLMTDWCWTDDNLIAFTVDSHQVRVANLQTGKIERLLQFSSSNTPTICRWHPKKVSGEVNSQDRLLAFGCADSSIYIYYYESKKHKKIPKKNKLAVQDMSWNPRENYLIVAFKDGSMSLVDDVGTQLMDFDRQGQGINSIAWIDNMSGDLITSSPKIGALKVWNVSHKSPRSTVKVGSTGVKSFRAFPDNPYRYLLAFRSGAVGIYNLSLKKLEFCTEAGHTETIFDLQFKPDNPNMMATVSYDGTTKIWDIQTMRLVKTLSLQKIDPGIQVQQSKTGTSAPPKVVCYGIAWGPEINDTRLAVTNNLGQLLMWDYEKERIIGKFEHNQAKVAIRVDWNHRKRHWVALNVDKFCYILSIDDYSDQMGNLIPTFSVKHKFTCPVVLFGASWNSFIPTQIAISGGEGFLKVYDVDVSKEQPIQVLKGHSGRVANLSWSPHFPQLLASTSDDKSVRVWNVETNDVRVLEGHTQNTRALSWNYQIPWLLVSGSWDSSIRVWDIRTGDAIYVIYDHIADVYGIMSHPKRPFVYASCSRDTSIRLWSFQGFVSPLKLKLVMRYELDKIITPDQTISPFHLLNNKDPVHTQNSNPLLGDQGKILVDNLKSPAFLEQVEGIKQLLGFIGVYDGQTELLSILGTIKEGRPSEMSSRIVHVSDSVSITKAKAEQLSSANTLAYLGTEFARKQDRLYQCARLLLQMGDYRRFCEILMDIGEQDRALAFAPAVSLAYWKQLAVRYAKRKEKQSTRDAAGLYQIANEINEAVRCLSTSQLYENAKLVKTLDSSKLYRNSAIQILEEGKEESKIQIPEEPLSLSKVKISTNLQEIPILTELVNDQAKLLFSEGKQILAAAAHLSINDINGCILKLYRSNELYLAYIIANTLSHASLIEIAQKMAERAERLMMNDFAANIYKTFDLGRKLALFASRLRNNQEPQAEDICSKYNIKSQSFYRGEAQKCKGAGNEVNLIFNYIMSGELESAGKVALTCARDAFKSGDPKMLLKMYQIFDIMEESRLNRIGEIRIKAQVLMYAAAIGALKATFLGFERVLTPLIGTVFSITEHQKLKPQFSLTMLESIENSVNSYIYNQKQNLQLEGKPAIRTPIHEMPMQFPNKKDGTFYATNLDVLRTYYKSKSDILRQGDNSYSTVGSTLPVNANLSGIRKSIFSSQIIRGLYFVLEDGSSHMSIEEALEWAEVNRYSPLNNGCRINPF